MDIPAYTELKQINLKKLNLPWNVRKCNISLYCSNIRENNFVLKWFVIPYVFETNIQKYRGKMEFYVIIKYNVVEWNYEDI